LSELNKNSKVEIKALLKNFLKLSLITRRQAQTKETKIKSLHAPENKLRRRKFETVKFQHMLNAIANYSFPI